VLRMTLDSGGAGGVAEQWLANGGSSSRFGTSLEADELTSDAVTGAAQRLMWPEGALRCRRDRNVWHGERCQRLERRVGDSGVDFATRLDPRRTEGTLADGRSWSARLRAAFPSIVVVRIRTHSHDPFC